MFPKSVFNIFRKILPMETDRHEISVTLCLSNNLFLCLFQMFLRLTMTLMVMLAFTPLHWGQQFAPCTFNSMCSCKFGGGYSRGVHFTTPKTLDNVKDIVCVGVPFSKLPGN